jgi:sigma-B regulation protein RsbU (phosphoserine phosphatase)
MAKDMSSYIENLKRQAAQFQDEIKKSKPYGLIRNYGDGMSSKEIESFLKRETLQAYDFYSRDQKKSPSEKLSDDKKFERGLVVAKNLFLSFLMKLTPARRLFYVVALVSFLWGLYETSWLMMGVSFVILNLLLALELADKLLAKGELEIARSIQVSLQPKVNPQLERLMLSSHYQPAREVGGDYYDFALLGENRFTLILGDVSGKGMPAALYAMKLQALFELLGKTRLGPKDMLVEMNDVFCEKIRRDYFITAVVGMMDFSKDQLALARAGHNLPIHFDASKEAVSWLNPKGLGIGMTKNPDFKALLEERTLSLGSEDLLLFYTDGITEAMNPQDQEFGNQRLERVLVENAHRSVDEIKERLLWSVTRFTEGAPLADDATLVIAKMK